MTTNLIFLAIFYLLAVTTTVSARPGIHFHPCATTTTTTTTTLIISTQNQNPNINPNFLFIHLRPTLMTDLPLRFSNRPQLSRPTEITDIPLRFTSFTDRAKDILNVVAALLFGAVCGALTAVTMFLIWSAINGRGNYQSIDSDSDSENDELFNPKKTHYVAIPAAPVKEKDSDDSATV